jgi:hypothetical protein
LHRKFWVAHAFRVLAGAASRSRIFLLISKAWLPGTKSGVEPPHSKARFARERNSFGRRVSVSPTRRFILSSSVAGVFR